MEVELKPFNAALNKWNLNIVSTMVEYHNN